MKHKLTSARGFSLVELLVVIAVIAVIAAIAIPNITGTREAAINAQGKMDTNNAVSILQNAQATGASNGSVALDLTNVLAGNAYTNDQGVVFQLTKP